MHLKFMIFGYFKEIAALAAEILEALSETIAPILFGPIFVIISSILFIKNSVVWCSELKFCKEYKYSSRDDVISINPQIDCHLGSVHPSIAKK